MSTITSKHLIDDLIATGGEYEDDPPVALIVEYENAYGGTAWGVTWVNETPDRQGRYLIETDFVRRPRVIWARPLPPATD